MPLEDRVKALKAWIRDFLYGMFYHQLYIDTMKFSSTYKDFIMLLVYGEMIGIPILSNTLTMRILPYVLKDIYGWRVRVLREKDLTDVTPEVG